MQQYNWSLVRFKILQSTVSKNWKISAFEKGKGSTSLNKQTEEQKKITIFCFNKLKVFWFFFWLTAVIKQYLKDSVQYVLKVWVSFNGITIDFFNVNQKFSPVIRGKLENLTSLGIHILLHSIETMKFLFFFHSQITGYAFFE